jgi:hypothetical protein
MKSMFFMECGVIAESGNREVELRNVDTIK